MLDRRNDDLLGIEEQLAIADHRRAKKDIRDMFLCNRNLDQPGSTGKMHELIAEQVVTFNAE